MPGGLASGSSPSNKRPVMARLWLWGAGWLGERGPASTYTPAPATWVRATGRGQPRSCLGGHAGLGRGSPSLELRPPLGHTPLPQPSRAWPRVPHTVHTGPARDGGACCLGGAEECGPPHPLAGLCSPPSQPPCCSLWPDWFGSQIRSVLPREGGRAVPGHSLWAVRHPSSPPRGVGRRPSALWPGVGCSRSTVASRGCGRRRGGGGLSGRATQAGRPPG